jgi:predicted ATPase
MDKGLRMSFSAPVLRQTQMAPKRSSLIPALASARVQRTDGARAPAFSRHPKLLIHLARVHQRISASKFGFQIWVEAASSHLLENWRQYLLTLRRNRRIVAQIAPISCIIGSVQSVAAFCFCGSAFLRE